MKTETISDLKKTMAEGAIALIDVREADEYAAGHVPGAVNLPLSDFENGLQTLDKSQTYHLICRSGARSARAVAFMEEQGYDAINVEGGTLAWDEGLEV